MVCVLAIIAILVAIVLPAAPGATSRSQLAAYATETAALLNGDRSVAQAQSRHVATAIDAPSRVVRSGATGRAIAYPRDVRVSAELASRCNGRSAGAFIHYFPSGMSCGGVITLARPGHSFEVRVNWLTGESEVAPTN